MSEVVIILLFIILSFSLSPFFPASVVFCFRQLHFRSGGTLDFRVERTALYPTNYPHSLTLVCTQLFFYCFNPTRQVYSALSSSYPIPKA